MERSVLLILIENRSAAAVKVQEILTRYGCFIKTRLGLHEVTPQVCSETGLIFIELSGDKKEHLKFEEELQKLKGVSVKLVELAIR